MLDKIASTIVQADSYEDLAQKLEDIEKKYRIIEVKPNGKENSLTVYYEPVKTQP